MQPRLPAGDLLITTVELGQGQIDSLAVEHSVMKVCTVCTGTNIK